MTLVQMNCKNCGAPLERRGNAYVCPHCGAHVLDIADASVQASGEVVSAEEFEERLKTQRASVSADFGGMMRVFDARTEVWNAQLRQADRLLQQGKPYGAEEALRGIPATVFPAERLRLLADVGARDEVELAGWSGDLQANPHFERVCTLGDAEQRRLYVRLAELCAENARTGAEIARGKVLLQSQAYGEAEQYAAAMCVRYPTDARAWELLIAARCGKTAEYDPRKDLERFFRCPNREILFGVPLEGESLPRTVSPLILDRMRRLEANRRAKGTVGRKLMRGAVVGIALLLLAVLWAVIDKLAS